MPDTVQTGVVDNSSVPCGSGVRLKDLSGGVLYSIEVSAVSAFGTSLPAVASLMAVIFAEPPLLSVSGNLGSTLTFNWAVESDGHLGGGSFLGFNVHTVVTF